MSKIFAGAFFSEHPQKILGKLVTHNPNTGRELTDRFGKPRPEVRGTLAEALKGIEAPVVKRYDHFFDQSVEPTRVQQMSAQRVTEVLQKTKDEDDAKASREYSCSKDLQCLADTIQKYNPGISEEELRVWVTYQTGKGLFDRSVIENNEWGKYLVAAPDWKSWFDAGLVAYDGSAYVPEVLFYSGNIYEKLLRTKDHEAAIVAEVGQNGYEATLRRLEEVKPTPLILSEDESRKLYLSPFDRFWDELRITELTDGTEVDGNTHITSIFAYQYLNQLSREDLVLDNKATTAYEIKNYWLDKSNKPRGMQDDRWASIRRNTALIGAYHFDRFLLSMLTEEDKARISYLWNRKSNNYREIDYHRIPVGFTSGKMFKGGTLCIRPAQREGVAFMNHRGTGIVAYDVGVGKTMTAIVGISDGFDKGLFRRPLIVVPQKVYQKWIGEIVGVYAEKDIKRGKKVIHKKGDLIAEGILPHIKINDYDNLGVNYVGRARNADGTAKRVAPYSVTIVTFEGLMKIGFNADTEGPLARRLVEMLSQGESGRAKAIVEQKAEEWVDKALRETELDIEEMGIDTIIVDEAHNFRNLFMEVKGDVGEDGEREKKHFYSGGGTPSSRAVKLFLLNAYVQDKNGLRNTFGLTATPFTNRATEIYSMMAHYDYQGLKDFDVWNIAQFCSKYIDETLESTWTAKGKFEINPVIRGYNNLPSLQAMIFRSINYKTGEEANIQRPEKVILPLVADENGVPLESEYIVDTKLKPTPEQERWLSEIRRFAQGAMDTKFNNYYFPNDKGMIEGLVLIALNASQAITFSPYILNLAGNAQYDIAEVTPEQFVRNSPKIYYTCECIRSVKEYHEAQGTAVSGQVIYSNRGTAWFGHIKEYLVTKVGYNPKEVELFHGGVSKGKRERIKDGFLAGDIKVIIGSSTLREGVDLQKYGAVLYNLYLDWNPTDLHQLMGRIWRFGNIFSHVRIVVPLMENSSDIFTWQKLSEKMSRLNSVWTRSNQTKMFEEKELDAEELKRGLINDPEEIVRWEIDEQLSELKSQLVIYDGNLTELQQASVVRDNYAKHTEKLNEYLEELHTRPNVKYGTEPEKVKALQEMPATSVKEIYRVLGRYAKLKPSYEVYYLRNAIDAHRKYSKRIKNIERKILSRAGLTIEDDFSDLLQEYETKVVKIRQAMEDVKSPENRQRLLEKAIAEKEEQEANRRPVSERVNEFQRLNYLLDCHHKVHSCDIYGRAEEIESGKAVAPAAQPERRMEEAYRYQWPTVLKAAIPKQQQKGVREILRTSENPKAYADSVLKPLTASIRAIPKIKATEDTPLQEKRIVAHYFMGDSDWYIAEFDPKRREAFGYTILNGDEQMAEWGYIPIAQFDNTPVELDFFWEPKPFAEIMGYTQSDETPPTEKPGESLASAIEALELALEFAEGQAKEPLETGLEALRIALEFAE